ncbi:class I SAM-dependent methyltransferase [Silvibacterium acidisoli]|uniref:class I SAM-dependent methyltransferase n=1 Tax=Acidobacteriaceae bacterium ZG23-2 TaxID=2883246 RepID=UPI00406D249F
MPADFSRIARPYRWMEYLSFGTLLESCRFYRLPDLRNARRALVFGDGDGRFLSRLLAINPDLRADVVDSSQAMLNLLAARVKKIGAEDRVTLYCIDALKFVPTGGYDLVVTHFFLDCLETAEVEALAQQMRKAVLKNAVWVVSDFAVPSNAARLPARMLICCLYLAFRLLTRLRTSKLPDHATALATAGFRRIKTERWLAGILVSELWIA